MKQFTSYSRKRLAAQRRKWYFPSLVRLGQVWYLSPSKGVRKFDNLLVRKLRKKHLTLSGEDADIDNDGKKNTKSDSI